MIDEFDKVVGCDRLQALHVNDSMTGLGSNRDRHVNPGDGEIGVEGMIAFLSEARFEGLPAILEGPGRSGKEIEPVDVAWAFDLRARGLAERLDARSDDRAGGGMYRLQRHAAAVTASGGSRPLSSALKPASPALTL